MTTDELIFKVAGPALTFVVGMLVWSLKRNLRAIDDAQKDMATDLRQVSATVGQHDKGLHAGSITFREHDRRLGAVELEVRDLDREVAALSATVYPPGQTPVPIHVHRRRSDRGGGGQGSGEAG